MIYGLTYILLLLCDLFHFYNIVMLLMEEKQQIKYCLNIKYVWLLIIWNVCFVNWRICSKFIVSFTYVFIEVQKPITLCSKIVFYFIFSFNSFVLISCKYLRMWVLVALYLYIYIIVLFTLNMVYKLCRHVFSRKITNKTYWVQYLCWTKKPSSTHLRKNVKARNLQAERKIEILFIKIIPLYFSPFLYDLSAFAFLVGDKNNWLNFVFDCSQQK